MRDQLTRRAWLKWFGGTAAAAAFAAHGFGARPLAVRPTINEFNGRSSVELRVRDISFGEA